MINRECFVRSPFFLLGSVAGHVILGKKKILGTNFNQKKKERSKGIEHPNRLYSRTQMGNEGEGYGNRTGKMDR